MSHSQPTGDGGYPLVAGPGYPLASSARGER